MDIVEVKLINVILAYCKMYQTSYMLSLAYGMRYGKVSRLRVAFRRFNARTRSDSSSGTVLSLKLPDFVVEDISSPGCST